MPYALGILTYPTESAKEFGQKFLELAKKKSPNYLKVLYPSMAAEHDIKGYVMYEIDKDKYFEGLKAIHERMAIFLGIPGFKYKVVPLLEPKDALPLVGLG